MIRRVKTGLSAAAKNENTLAVRNHPSRRFWQVSRRGAAQLCESSHGNSINGRLLNFGSVRTTSQTACAASRPSTIEDIRFAQSQIRGFALGSTGLHQGSGNRNAARRRARAPQRSGEQRRLLHSGRSLSDGGLRTHERGNRQGCRSQARRRLRSAIRRQAASGHRDLPCTWAGPTKSTPSAACKPSARWRSGRTNSPRLI